MGAAKEAGLKCCLFCRCLGHLLFIEGQLRALASRVENGEPTVQFLLHCVLGLEFHQSNCQLSVGSVTKISGLPVDLGASMKAALNEKCHLSIWNVKVWII